MTASQYLEIADLAVRNGLNGPVSVVHYNGRNYRVVINGFIEHDGHEYRIVRSIVNVGAKADPYPGYEINIRVVQGPRFVKPDFPEWSKESIKQLVQQLEAEYSKNNRKKATYEFCWPVHYFVRIRKK